MRKELFVLCMAMCLCVACGKRQVELQPSLSASVTDTIQEVCLDTLDMEDSDELFSSPVEENFFAGEDGFFEEFLYEFCLDSLMQKHRIQFPLPYLCNNTDKERMLSEDEWFSSNLFVYSDVYHTLFERDAEMNVESDSTLKKVNLECIDLVDCHVRVFCFEKVEKHWCLQRVREHDFTSYKHREFFTFYHRFVTDSLYQSSHVNDPMTFVTLDPEDEFTTIEANIDMEQWFAFRPMLPERLMVNVDYGVKSSRRPSRKILTCKSLEGNFSHTSYFRKIKGEWMLTRFEEMNN